MTKEMYWVYWECVTSGVGDTIGYYWSLEEAERAFKSAIKENKHCYYGLRGNGEDRLYEPNGY